MSEQFFEKPILNSPYAYPGRHWELDADGQPTNRIFDNRRRSDLITPVPKTKKQRQNTKQAALLLGTNDDLSTTDLPLYSSNADAQRCLRAEPAQKLRQPGDGACSCRPRASETKLKADDVPFQCKTQPPAVHFLLLAGLHRCRVESCPTPGAVSQTQRVSAALLPASLRISIKPRD